MAPIKIEMGISLLFFLLPVGGDEARNIRR